jgi:four helix bundle protein
MEKKRQVGKRFFKFERLDVWNRSITWANSLFDVAVNLPQTYQYSLAEQLKRAALSVPTNIAEGVGRDQKKESAYFYRVAKGSVYEVVSLMKMVESRGLVSEENYRALYTEANELAAMLSGLIKQLR